MEALRSLILQTSHGVAGWSRYAGGVNLLAVNTAPCGSLRTVIRTHGASNGGTSTLPPSFAVRSAIASASSTENVMLQCGGVSSGNCSLVIGTNQATASSKAVGRSNVGPAGEPTRYTFEPRFA